MLKNVRWACWLLIFVLSCSLPFTPWARSAMPQAVVNTSNSSPKPAEEVFKNIQIFKGIPSTELPPIMHFIRSSLGVRCEFCHVAENGKYQLDEKKEKKRAREMILMTRRINEVNFGGRNVINCNTCHQGSIVPDSHPRIGSSYVNIIRRGPDELPPDALPSVSEVFERYEAATHVSSLNSARVTLEGCHAKLVDVGTPNARAIPRAACSTAEVVVKLDEHGDKAVVTSPLPGGQSVRVGSDGKRGWTVGPDGLRWIDNVDFEQFQRRLDPLLVMRVRPADFSSSNVSGVRIINGRESYGLEAVGIEGTAQELWFSKDDGFLMRRTFYHPIALGLEPEQFDFSDYQSFGGIKLASQINTSYLDDQHLGILKKLVEVKLGAIVSDREFVPPEH